MGGWEKAIMLGIAGGVGGGVRGGAVPLMSEDGRMRSLWRGLEKAPVSSPHHRRSSSPSCSPVACGLTRSMIRENMRGRRCFEWSRMRSCFSDIR